MSYYDRLNKVISEQEGGTGKVQDAIAMAKERSQDAFSATQAQASGLMSGEINKFAEEFGIKQASKLALKQFGKRVIVPRVQAGREALDARGAAAEGQISDLGEEAAGIFAKGVTRMSRLGTDVTIRQASTLEQPAAAFDATNPFQQPRGLGAEQDAPNTVGKRLTDDPEGEYGTEETSGLTQTEVARISDINEATEGLADTVVSAGVKTYAEAALDAVPVVGEIALMGAMFGGMIHTGHHAHIQQMADDSSERTDLQNVQAAQMYSGFNRPNFGSMALPSFDTSKNPTLLQE